MMQAMRDNMKIVIWITAIVFMVGFGILQLGGVLNSPTGQGPTGVIASVNGRPIRYDEFMRLYTDLVQQVQQEREMEQGEDSYVREQAYQQLLQQKLMEAEVERRGIKASPEEIKAAIRHTPPEFLTQVPAFQTEGKFDYRKYVAELDNPSSQMPWGQVEAYVASVLPAQKLRDQIWSTVKISDGELRERFQYQNDTIDLQFLRFVPDSFPVDSSQVGPSDIQSYYKSNPDEFSGPEEVKLRIVQVPRVPDESDFGAARQRLQGIADQIRVQPDSFPKYARTYSEIQSAERGGEAPADPIVEQMRPKLRDGLMNVQAGQLSPVIQEERSVHLFRVDKRYPDKETGKDRIHYHEIVLRVRPGPQAIRVAREKVEALLKDAKSSGLSSAATKHGLQVGESPFFSAGRSQNPTFQRFPETERWAFRSKIGSISAPIPHESGWQLYEVAERRAAGVKPFEDVRGIAKVATFRMLQLERAKGAAEQARAALAAGMRPEEASIKFRGTLGMAQKVTRMGYIGTVGRETKIVGPLFRMPTGTWSPVLTGVYNVMVVRVESRNTPSEETYQASVAQLRENALSQRRQEVFKNWLENLRRHAAIKDYRQDFFEI